MADKNSGDKQPWAVPVLVALVGAISAVIVAWINKSQQPIPQIMSSPQAVSPSPSIQSFFFPLAPTSSDKQKYEVTGVWESKGSRLGDAIFYVRQVDSTVLYGY